MPQGAGYGRPALAPQALMCKPWDFDNMMQRALWMICCLRTGFTLGLTDEETSKDQQWVVGCAHTRAKSMQASHSPQRTRAAAAAARCAATAASAAVYVALSSARSCTSALLRASCMEGLPGFQLHYVKISMQAAARGPAPPRSCARPL